MTGGLSLCVGVCVGVSEFVLSNVVVFIRLPSATRPVYTW